MKILFVISELGMIDPAGVAYLSAVARDLGHERYLCVLNKQDIVKRIGAVKPDIIAYSFNSCDASEVFKIHNEKVKATGIFTIMGGSHPTLYPQSFLESGADVYCVGEGEAVFADVLCARVNGQCVDDIPNLITANRSNPPRKLLDLATLPLPDRDLVLSDKFMSDFPRKTFLASRGCPHSCSYCFNSALKNMYRGQRWVRRFSVEHVIRQVKDVRSKHRLEFVKFDDDNFAVAPDVWLEEFAGRYAREVRLPFNCLIRLDSASDKMLELLRTAGCYSITTSVDSANQRIREDILGRTTSRPMTNMQIKDAMLRIKRYGINLFVNYITSIPTATEEDEINTIRLSKAGKVTYSNYTTLVPFCGTEIWEYCKNSGYSLDTGIPSSLIRRTALKGFTQHQQQVQRNVLLLGAYNYVVPSVFIGAFTRFLLWVKPNKLFSVMYSLLKSYLVGFKIYRNRDGLIRNLKTTIRATKSDLSQV